MTEPQPLFTNSNSCVGYKSPDEPVKLRRNATGDDCR